MASSAGKTFLDLSLETRQRIYRNLFLCMPAFVDVDADNSGNNGYMTGKLSFVYPSSRSAQVLRVCRSIFYAARPILMENTHFVVNRSASIETVHTARSVGLATLPFLTQLHIKLPQQEPGTSPHMDLTRFKELQVMTVSLATLRWATSRLGELEFRRDHSNLLRFFAGLFSTSKMVQFLDESIDNREIRFVMYKKVNLEAKKKVQCFLL